MIDPEIIIHLGTYKTGSSSIQNTLWTNRETLRAQSVLYPESGLLKLEPEVGFRHAQLVYNYKNNINAWSDKVISLIEEIKESECNKVIISCEAWSRQNQTPSLESLLEKLKGAGFNNFSAICYFRNQEKYAHSCYGEFTRRRGNKRRFDEYVKINRKIFDYLLLAKKFNKIFENNVKYNMFDEIDDITVNFFNSLDINMEKILFEQSSTLSNRGLSAIEIELFRLFNEQGKDLKKLHLNLESIVNRISQLINVDLFTEKADKNIFIADGAWKKKLKLQTGFSTEQIDKLTKVNKELKSKMDIGTLTEVFNAIISDTL